MYYQMNYILLQVIHKDIIKYVITNYSTYLKKRKFTLDIAGGMHNVCNVLYDNINKIVYIRTSRSHYIYNLINNNTISVNYTTLHYYRCVIIHNNIGFCIRSLSFQDQDEININLFENILLNYHADTCTVISVPVPFVYFDSVYISTNHVYIASISSKSIYIFSMKKNNHRTIKIDSDIHDDKIHIYETNTYIYIYLPDSNIIIVYLSDTLQKVNEYIIPNNDEGVAIIKNDLLYLLKRCKQYTQILIYNAIIFEKLSKIRYNHSIEQLFFSNEAIFFLNNGNTIRMYE